MISANHIRQIILEQSRRAHVGHIGSALSVADIVAALYTDAICAPCSQNPERDRLVLSKGHAVLAVYAALHLKGWLSEDDLDSYCADNSLLGVHPEHALKGIDFCTGSLGHGLSLGVGAALAARLQGSPRRTFVLMSDAECNEGSIWEAVMCAAHHKLSNLTVVIDLNGQQALGYTEDVLDMADMGARWEAFGWNVHHVDGHDAAEMGRIMSNLAFTGGKPHVLIAHTTFGKGVSYMENEIKWHYWPMSEAEYAQARDEVEAKVGTEERAGFELAGAAI